MKSLRLSCISAITVIGLLVIPAQSAAPEQQEHKQPRSYYNLTELGASGDTFSSGGFVKDELWVTGNADGSPKTSPVTGSGVVAKCERIGGSCFGPSSRCCRAPFPHHSFCSSRTGWGVCLMN
jgi:hypothetical protein